MQPRIAIPQPHSNLDYAQRVMPSYAHAVELAGGIPVDIPLALSNVEIMRLAMSCDGVLLPGSRADVNPEKYGQQRLPETHESDPLRDNVDELLLQDAYNMHKPILAICFGTQILNVWRTGTLIQHLQTGVPHTGNHDVRHAVIIKPGSRLAAIVDHKTAPSAPAGEGGTLLVNTSHHQAIDQPGDGLRVVAWSEQDRVIEAVEGTSGTHFIIAVQWHPERLVDDADVEVRAAARALFSAFVDAAAVRHQQPRTPAQADFEKLGAMR